MASNTSAEPRCAGSGTPTAEPRPEFRPDVEGLRGIAILLVVGYHAGLPAFGGGYVGVDVFFVLSGYLITWLLIKECFSTGRIGLARFYARRARRLLPAVTAMLLLSMIAGYILLAPLEQHRNVIAALATALYVSNVYFAAYSLDYMGPEADSYPLLHTWSLGVEEQFYLLWPLLILVALHGVRGSADGSFRRRLGVMFFVLLAASFALSIQITQTRQPWAFFLPLTRAWEFAIGGLTILFASSFRTGGASPGAKYAIDVFGWLGLVLIIVSGAVFDQRTPFPGAWALLPTIGTALVLIAGSRSERWGVGATLRVAPLRWIGRVSYSWYLWHWPVLILAEVASGTSGHAQTAACLALSLGLAVLSFHFVEQPVRRSPALVASPRTALAMGALLSLVGAGAAGGWGYAAHRAVESPPHAQFAEAAADRVARLPPGCTAGFFDVRIRDCALGDPESRTHVVLFGDSHAAQWYPALNDLAESNGWRIIPLIKQACPAADVVLHYPRLGRMYHECPAWRRAAFDRIETLRPALTVVASSYAYAGFMGAVTLPEWEEGMRRTFTALSAASDKVLLIRDTPRPGFDVPECLSRAAWQPAWLPTPGCSFRMGADSQRVFERERAAAAGFPNAATLDLTNRFCFDTACPPVLDGVVAYRDSNHITATMARRLALDLQPGL